MLNIKQAKNDGSYCVWLHFLSKWLFLCQGYLTITTKECWIGQRLSHRYCLSSAVDGKAVFPSSQIFSCSSVPRDNCEGRITLQGHTSHSLTVLHDFIIYRVIKSKSCVAVPPGVAGCRGCCPGRQMWSLISEAMLKWEDCWALLVLKEAKSISKWGKALSAKMIFDVFGDCTLPLFFASNVWRMVLNGIGQTRSSCI